MAHVSTRTKEAFFDKHEDGTPFIQCGPYQLQFEDEPLDEVYQKRAFEEIGETDEVQRNAIDVFRQLIDAEQDLCIPQNVEFFLKFLRPNNFDAQMAFTKMRNYYMIIANNPRYLNNATPEVVEDVFTKGVLRLLPYRADGVRLVIVDLEKWDPRVVPLETILKAFMICIEIGMKEPITQLCGVRVILDTQGINMRHIYICNPWIAKFLMDLLKNIPLKVKGIHVVYQNWVFNIGYAFFKPFISGPLKDEIILHGNNLSTLHDHISPKYLPKRYNGEVDIPNIPGDLMVEMIKYYEQYFQEHRSYGYLKETQQEQHKNGLQLHRTE